MKCNWSVSAAHLYIFGWTQIKFSEVETEELRFGEQCGHIQKLNRSLNIMNQSKELLEQMVASIHVTSVTNNLQHTVSSKLTFSLNMKVWGMIVTSVTIKQHIQVIWDLIFSLNMKVSSMLAISVIITKLQNEVIWQDILNLNIKVCSMLVISVVVLNYNVYIFHWKYRV